MPGVSPTRRSSRREFLCSTAALALTVAQGASSARRWPLGLNTYCLRFQRWNDRRLIDYCVEQKLDAIFLQDSQDPGLMDPAHWAEVRAWTRDLGLHLESGGAGVLSSNADDDPRLIGLLRREIERAVGLGSPIVRARVANDRYTLPEGPLERQMDRAVRILREVRSQALDAGVKIGIENHKELQAWETRWIIESAGREFAGSYLDTGNPVFVAEDPATTLEELGPYAMSFHLRDSVVYDQPDGVAVQWVPLGEGTVDFKAILERADEILPSGVHVYYKPITARPPVVLPVYFEAFWRKWFPRARSSDLSRFLALARRGRPYDKPQIVADVPGERERYMDALQHQQIDHMERSLEYCRKALDLGVRWRGVRP